jgi:hypothetical protein
MHWPINSRNVYFYLHIYKNEIGINVHDDEFDILYHMCMPVSSKDLNFYRHMPWSFCVQWVNMRGDGSFSRNLWICWHHCLNFPFLSVYVHGVHITGSFWRCVSPISQTVDLCTIYTVLDLEFKECHQTMFFFSRQMAQICRNSLSPHLSHFVKQHADSRITFCLTTYSEIEISNDL